MAIELKMFPNQQALGTPMTVTPHRGLPLRQGESRSGPCAWTGWGCTLVTPPLFGTLRVQQIW